MHQKYAFEKEGRGSEWALYLVAALLVAYAMFGPPLPPPPTDEASVRVQTGLIQEIGLLRPGQPKLRCVVPSEVPRPRCTATAPDLSQVEVVSRGRCLSPEHVVVQIGSQYRSLRYEHGQPLSHDRWACLYTLTLIP